MRKLTVLLALNGSEESLQASRCAFSLAKTLGAKLLALHVVDRRSAWDLLGFKKPGLIGSGMYLSAYEALCASMCNLANKLMEKFEAVAAAENIEVESVIADGNPIDQICLRAKECDFIIIGHQPTSIQSAETGYSPFIRRSIAEGVIHNSAKPVLLVQGDCVRWKRFKILVSMDHINVPYIRACHIAAHSLGAEAEIVCLSTGVHEERPAEFSKDLYEAHPDLKHVSISYRFLGDQITEKAQLWSHKSVDIKLQGDVDELFVVPTRGIGQDRITIFGSHPELFVDNLTLPNILFWPEEHVDEWTQAVIEEGLSDRLGVSYTLSSKHS